MAAMLAELGGEGFGKAVAESWGVFAGDADKLVCIAPVGGLKAGAAAFRALVDNSAKADVATVVHM